MDYKPMKPHRNIAKTLVFLCIYVVNIYTAKAQTKYTLEQCITYALTHNTQMARAALNNEQTQSNLKYTNADRFPSLNANVSHNFNFGKTIDQTTNQFTNLHTQTEYYSLSTDMLLFNGFQKNNQVKQAQHQVDASGNFLDKTKNDISLLVASNYLQVLLMKERLKQVETQVTSSKEQADKMEILVKNGAQRQSKLLEAKAALAADQATFIETENLFTNAILSLKQSMNFKIQDFLEVEDMPEDIALTDYTNTDLQKALDLANNLPQMKQLLHLVTASEYALRAAKGNISPKLYGSASLHSGYSSVAKSYDYKLNGLDTIGYVYDLSKTPVVAPGYSIVTDPINFGKQFNDNFGQSVGLSLSVPIFNGFQTKNSIVNSKINLEEAKLNLTDAENTIKNGIYQSYQDMVAAKKHWAAQQTSLDLQKLLYEQGKLTFEQGMLGYYEWNNLKTTFDATQSQWLAAKFQYIFAVKAFEVYLGKGVGF